MYKTGHAFSYLLLKESVANDIINVSLFAGPACCEPLMFHVQFSIELLHAINHSFRQLVQSYTFVPVVVETLGPINNESFKFLSDLVRRISQVFNDHRESALLLKRLSVLIKRFNAVATQGTFAHIPTEDDI